MPSIYIYLPLGFIYGLESEIEKWENIWAFKHAQNVQIHIILRKRKVSSGPLLSTDTFDVIKYFW